MVLRIHGPFNIYYNEGIVDSNKLNRFKKIMSILETSGGKNTNHKTMTSGLHKGSTAIGNYGLMPLTIQDMAKRLIRTGSGDELDAKIAQMSPEEAKKLVPELVKNKSFKYEQYADVLAEHVLNKYGSEDKAAMAWNQGHYSSNEKIEDMMRNPKTEHQANYLPRFKKALKMIGPQMIADKAFETTEGVMETDPTKSPYAAATTVNIDKNEETRSPAFMDPIKEIINNIVDPRTIKYKKERLP